MTRPAVVWLRDDLRLDDNPALAAAAARGGPIVLLYLLDEVSPEARPLGGASRWWLHGSLSSLADAVAGRGGRLTLRRGAAETELPRVVAETGADAVYWNRRYGASREVDARLKERLRDDGLEVRSFGANLLHEPWTVQTEQGAPYRVFTPFWRAAQERPVRDLAPAPDVLDPVDVDGDDLAAWALLPTAPDWAGGLRETWTPGETAARDALEDFVADTLGDYHERDRPELHVTSRLSPRLRFGEVSPVQVWHRLNGELDDAGRRNAGKFLSELGWREFNTSILFSTPELATRNYRSAFDGFEWADTDPDELEAWRHGRTGIPLVDAGMRELWRTGYMHNRVRMITASFLVKNLLTDWRVGEQWFWDTLVDSDEANNAANWQWVAGSGADAAPYFRVFNPELQRTKFDPHGRYVRRWVPEYGTPEYPEPIVDLGETRRRALAAYERMRRTAPA